MLLPALLLLTCVVSAQQRNYTEASDLTLIGKVIDTPNPYHRVDTVAFKGFTVSENFQVRQSAGLAVVFRTDSRSISVKTEYGQMSTPINTMGIAAIGYDLYIKQEGGWLWAGCGADKRGEKLLVTDMDGGMKECLVYLPLLAEQYSVKIGTDQGSVIEPIPSPFRHRVAIFGSSFTHGISCDRPGATYPAQFTRNTGIQLLSLGCSGNCKLQPYFADVLAAADVDAYIFDAFSNPSPQMIKERLFPFIERLQAAHPGVPLIFQRTIRRENINFDLKRRKNEVDRLVVADSMMNLACKRYKDVYYITQTNATSEDHETSVDGVHPTNYGYTLWAKSIEKPVLKILKKYNIR